MDKSDKNMREMIVKPGPTLILLFTLSLKINYCLFPDRNHVCMSINGLSGDRLRCSSSMMLHRTVLMSTLMSAMSADPK